MIVCWGIILKRIQITLIKILKKTNFSKFMYYTIFASTFVVTSLACAYIDFNLPKLRKTTKKNEDIKADYKTLIA